MEAFGSRAVCVTVDGTRRILNGLDWRTTAEDVIRRLKPNSGPQILVESWHGCIRRIGKDEYICQLLEEWGDEARNIHLVIMSPLSLPGYRLVKQGLNKTMIYKAQQHGKVASNKRRCLSRRITPKKDIAGEIARLIGRAEAARERLSAVEMLGTSSLPESPSFELTASEEEEWVALQEQLAEEEQEKRELEERRKEIKNKIDTHSEEIATVKKRNSELQRKLLQEQEKQKRLSSKEKSSELKQAESDVEQLQNELKVRMKLNQLQATKLQEISALISAIDQETTQEKP